MKRTQLTIGVLICIAGFTAACSSDRTASPLSPSTSSALASSANASPAVSASTAMATNSLVGTWVSNSRLTPNGTLPSSLSQCSNMRLTIASQTATLATGSLTMSCPGGIAVSGTITGQLGGANIPLVYAGTATLGGESCSFQMNGIGYPLGGDNFRFEYTGTSCLGPIYGTETLRLGSNSEPTPAPTATPTPSADAISLAGVRVYNSPADVASWALTSRITSISMSPSSGLNLEFTTKNSWPDYTPPGWDGPLQYTVWAVVTVGGQWYTTGFIQMWRGRASTGAPILTDFAPNWAYDARWGPMAHYRPHVGEQMGFFVTAGNARGIGTVTSLRERSNVVVVSLPAGDSGFFPF
jgi:hypothetical protein